MAVHNLFRNRSLSIELKFSNYYFRKLRDKINNFLVIKNDLRKCGLFL